MIFQVLFFGQNHKVVNLLFLFQIDTSANYQQQGNTYSAYKHSNVVNILYWILPGGQFAGCSKPIEGCISDRQLLIASGLLPELDKGDHVLMDRGSDHKLCNKLLTTALRLWPIYIKNNSSSATNQTGFLGFSWTYKKHFACSQVHKSSTNLCKHWTQS